ncbi:YjgP/YjgQ family permease [bacterium]|nr:MAG: YjgP/YjgQ family permease [bacterium]
MRASGSTTSEKASARRAIKPLKRVDYLVLKEIVGPWTFGVGLFTALIMAGTYLGRLTGFLVGGTSPLLVGQLFLLYLPALLVKTFSMSMLLAGLLGFGRLSSDSEIVALKASGASLPRIIRPVFLAALVVSIVTFAFNEIVVPKAAKTALSLTTQLLREGKVGGKAFAQPIVRDGKIVAMINAVRADLSTNLLKGVTVLVYDKEGKESMLLIAPAVRFNPRAIQDWRIEGGARIVPIEDPRAVMDLTGGAWPAGIPKPTGTLEDMLVKKDDYDQYTISEIRVRIAQMKRDGDKEPQDIRDYEYGYFNKYSVAFAALVFGTLGAVLGIRNHRTGTAAGFALAVGIIFGYITLANFMNVWASGGILPPWAASFAPLCIGAVACGVIIYRRNA